MTVKSTSMKLDDTLNSDRYMEFVQEPARNGGPFAHDQQDSEKFGGNMTMQDHTQQYLLFFFYRKTQNF